MSKQNSAALFIRLLTEAYEEDRLIRKARFTAQNRALAASFKKQQLAALHQFREALEPLDCVQLMTRDFRERHHG